MSVNTRASECIDGAKEKIQLAIEDLGEILIKRVWGTEDYTDVYLAKLKCALDHLMFAREQMKTEFKEE